VFFGLRKLLEKGRLLSETLAGRGTAKPVKCPTCKKNKLI
jgi:hypothetical protein